MTTNPRPKGPAGMAVDSSGLPVVDPTANVIALTEAAVQRQDDLRESNNKYLESEIRHLREMASLRAEHGKVVGELETNRLNAIRQVDVLAVSTAADRAQAAISTLAAQTTANAENLRNALTVTATTIANQTAATVAAITERLAALEKAGYESKGKSAFSDPMFSELLTEVKSLREGRSQAGGQSKGINMVWVAVLGFLGAVGTLTGVISLILKMTGK